MQIRYLYLLKQHQHFGTLGALTDVLKDRQKNKKDKEYEDNIDNIRKDNNVNNSNSNRNSNSNK